MEVGLAGTMQHVNTGEPDRKGWLLNQQSKFAAGPNSCSLSNPYERGPTKTKHWLLCSEHDGKNRANGNVNLSEQPELQTRLLVSPLAFPSCPTSGGQMAKSILQLSMVTVRAVLQDSKLCRHLPCQCQGRLSICQKCGHGTLRDRRCLDLGGCYLPMSLFRMQEPFRESLALLCCCDLRQTDIKTTPRNLCPQARLLCNVSRLSGNS